MRFFGGGGGGDSGGDGRGDGGSNGGGDGGGGAGGEDAREAARGGEVGEARARVVAARAGRASTCYPRVFSCYPIQNSDQ